MKPKKGFCMVFWSVMLLITEACGETAASEIVRAHEYLENHGVVYFSFDADAYRRIERLGDRISIDRIQNGTIFAYANKREFDWFLTQSIEYEVLVPPGMRVPAPTLAKKSVSSSVDSFSYPTFDGFLAAMEHLAVAYPSICSVADIGESILGRRMVALKISDNVSAKEPEPEFLCTGTIHGDETIGMMLLKKMAEYLCMNYGKDSAVTRIVDGLELWMIPLANPDGMYMNGFNDSPSGPVRENAYGMDLNRNFPDPEFGWKDAVLQKETRNIINFALQHHFTMGFDIHAGIESVVLPFAYTGRYPVDKAWWVHVAGNYVRTQRAAIKLLVGEDYIEDTTAGYLSAGAEYFAAHCTFIDFPYHFLHCRSLTLELSWMKYPPEESLEMIWKNNRDAMLGLFTEAMWGIRGIVTDSATGSPIAEVKIFVDGLDADSSFTRSNGTGVFFRPIIAGNYNITFSTPGYGDKTISGIVVVNGQPTVLEVALSPGTHVRNSDLRRSRTASPAVWLSAQGLMVDGGNFPGWGAMYDLSGRTLGKFALNGPWGSGSIVRQGVGPVGTNCANGCMLVKLMNGSSVTGVYRVVNPAGMR